MRLTDADALLAEYDRVHVGPPGRARKLIENAPTITPGLQWIPVSERLPEEAGTYICTCMDGKRLIVTVIKWQPKMISWLLTGARSYWKVLAWMPLPEPYEEVTT